jgi:hypothetical protein
MGGRRLGASGSIEVSNLLVTGLDEVGDLSTGKVICMGVGVSGKHSVS